jgi:hypothetical protein
MRTLVSSELCVHPSGLYEILPAVGVHASGALSSPLYVSKCSKQHAPAVPSGWPALTVSPTYARTHAITHREMRRTRVHTLTNNLAVVSSA